MSYTEDHLVEQPAIQLMQHELGWDVGGNIEHRNPNIERRSEEKRKKRTKSALHRLNPDLPVEAIEGAVEERGILNVGFWILNGRGGRPSTPRLNPFHPALGRTEAASAASLALAIHRFPK